MKGETTKTIKSKGRIPSLEGRRYTPETRYVGIQPSKGGKIVQGRTLEAMNLREKLITPDEFYALRAKKRDVTKQRDWCIEWDPNPRAHHRIPAGKRKRFPPTVMRDSGITGPHYLCVPFDQPIEVGDYVGYLRLEKIKTYTITEKWNLKALSFQERKTNDDIQYIRREPTSDLKSYRDMYGWFDRAYRIERDKLREERLQRQFRGRSKYPKPEEEAPKQTYADWLARKTRLKVDRLNPNETENQVGYVLRDMDSRRTRHPLNYTTWYDIRADYRIRSTGKDRRGVSPRARNRQSLYHNYSNQRHEDLTILPKGKLESMKQYLKRSITMRKRGSKELQGRHQRYGRTPIVKTHEMTIPSRPAGFVYKRREMEGNPMRTYKEAIRRRYKYRGEWKTHYERSWYMTKRRAMWKGVYKREKVAQTKNRRRSSEFTVGHSGKGQGGSYEWGHGQARFSVTKRALPMNVEVEMERHPENRRLTVEAMPRVKAIVERFNELLREKSLDDTRSRATISESRDGYIDRFYGQPKRDSKTLEPKEDQSRPHVRATITHATRDRYGQLRYAPKILPEEDTVRRSVRLYKQNLGSRGSPARRGQTDRRKLMEKRVFRRTADRGVQLRVKVTRTKNGFMKKWVYNMGSYIWYGCWDPTRIYARPRDYRVGTYAPEVYLETTPRDNPVKSWYHMQIAERDNAKRLAVSKWEAKGWEPYRVEKIMNSKMWIGYWVPEDRRYLVKNLDERMHKFVTNKKIQLALDKAGSDIMKDKKTFMSIVGDPERYYEARAELRKKELLERYAMQWNHLILATKQYFAEKRVKRMDVEIKSLDEYMQKQVDKGSLGYDEMKLRDIRTEHRNEMKKSYRRTTKAREKIESLPSTEPKYWTDWYTKPKGDSRLGGFRGIKADMKVLTDYGKLLARSNW